MYTYSITEIDCMNPTVILRLMNTIILAAKGRRSRDEVRILSLPVMQSMAGCNPARAGVGRVHKESGK